jgi:hypothetical protein
MGCCAIDVVLPISRVGQILIQKLAGREVSALPGREDHEISMLALHLL